MQLSVIIPVFNTGQLLVEAIDSVVNQQSAIDTIEILIIDDQSTDEEFCRLLSTMENSYTHVRVLHNVGNKGVAAARNYGVKMAKGTWIAFLDSDDIWLPGSLQARWDVTNRFPEAEWVTGDFALFSESIDLHTAKGFYKARYTKRHFQYLRKAYELDKPLRIVKPVKEAIMSFISHTDVTMIRKDLFIRAGGFDERLEQSEDFSLWHYLAVEADLIFVPRILACYRQHSESLTKKLKEPFGWQILALKKLIKDKRFNTYKPIIRQELGKFYDANAYYFIKNGEFIKAITTQLCAIFWDPCRIQLWRNILSIFWEKEFRP